MTVFLCVIGFLVFLSGATRSDVTNADRAVTIILCVMGVGLIVFAALR